MERSVRIDVFLNDGKGHDGRRLVLNTEWEWSRCLRAACDKLGARWDEDQAVLFSSTGSRILGADELIDGESAFFSPLGKRFLGAPAMAVGPEASPALGRSASEGGKPRPTLGGGGGGSSGIASPRETRAVRFSAGVDGESVDELQLPYVYLFKFIIVGNIAVGKSCLLLQFTDKRFRESHDATIGVDFGSSVITVDDKPVKVQIWDTAGQEDFRAITRAYYREAAAALLCYDISNRQSFRKVQNWLDAVRAHTSNENIVLCVVGNKVDLDKVAPEKRSVSTEEGAAFARKNDALFFETSAKLGTGVEQAFADTAACVYDRIKSGVLDPSNPKNGIRTGSTSPRPRRRKRSSKSSAAKDSGTCC